MKINQPPEPERQRHDWWIYGAWGIILGFSRCEKCGRLATKVRMEQECQGDPEATE